MKSIPVAGRTPRYHTLLFYCAAVVGLYGLGRYLARPVRLVFVVDARLSEYARVQLEQCITLEELSRYSISDSARSVAQRVAAVSDLSVRYTSSGAVVVRAYAFTPLAVVNKRWVVVPTGAMVAAEDFHEGVLDTLVALRMHDRAPLHSSGKLVAEFIRRLPDELKHSWDITWHDKTNIELIDPSMPHVRVIAHHGTRFTPELLAAIARVGAEQRDKKLWRIDVRMKNQMIRTRIQGEGR